MWPQRRRTTADYRRTDEQSGGLRMAERRGGRVELRARAQRAAMFVLALAVVCALWELYKAVGPEAGGKILGMRLLPKAENRAMPHVWDMVRRFGRPELRG